MSHALLASEMRNTPNLQHCFGIRDGILDTLLCLLGPERGAEIDVKYPIPRNYFEGETLEELREWAEDWVQAILDQKAEEGEGLAGSFYESLIENGVK